MNDVNIFAMSAVTSSRPYHHGDLRNALVVAATELAARDGPEGVVLRETARRIGVSPSAAYRHFPSRDGLLAVVGSEARQALAERFRACGREYVRFALDEPGLFAVAFRPSPTELHVPEDPSPYHVLAASLDQLAEAGLLAVPRAGAEEYAWVGVHGAAVLLGTRAIHPAERDRVIEGTLDMIANGLLRGSDTPPGG